MRTMVIGYDGGERSKDALALGRRLARLMGTTEILVATVYEQLTPKSGPDDERPAQRRLREAAVAALERAREACPELDADALHAVCANDPAEGLQRFARERDADLIVVGASHRTGLGRIWPGSATEQTLQGAPCAIAVAPPEFSSTWEVDPGRIGVAFDGSEESRGALALAATLARAAGCAVTVLDVVDTTAPPVAAAYGYGGFVDEMRQVAVRHLEWAQQELARHGVEQVDPARPEGPPARELIAASEQLDLLVMGSHGRSAIGRVLLGTVSRDVVRSAACPVIVVPRPAERGAPAAAADEQTTA